MGILGPWSPVRGDPNGKMWLNGNINNEGCCDVKTRPAKMHWGPEKLVPGPRSFSRAGSNWEKRAVFEKRVSYSVVSKCVLWVDRLRFQIPVAFILLCMKSCGEMGVVSCGLSVFGFYVKKPNLFSATYNLETLQLILVPLYRRKD